MADITVRLLDVLGVLSGQPNNVDNAKLAYENINANTSVEKPANVDITTSDTISLPLESCKYEDTPIRASGNILFDTVSIIDKYDACHTEDIEIEFVDSSNASLTFALIKPNKNLFQRRENIMFFINVKNNGTVIDSGISWYSTIDGKIGDGSLLEYSRLSIGRHTIYVIVDGYASTFSFQIEVTANPTPGKPYELGEM